MAKPTRTRNGKWEIRWMDLQGVRRSKTFIRHSDAQRALKRREVEVEQVREGLVPASKPADRRRTFSELADYWLKHRTTAKRSPKDDRSIIEHHLRPRFGPCLLRAIDETAISTFALELKTAGRAPQTVANIVGLLESLLGQAVALGWLSQKPKVQRPKPDDYEFNWIDSLDGVRAFLRAAQEEERAAERRGMSLAGLATMYATSVYTGARAGEVAALTWPAVNLDARLITIAKSFDRPTKTNKVRHVPILEALLPMLKRWKLQCPPTEGSLVFPNARNKMHARNGRVFKTIYRRVLDAAGVAGHYPDRRLRYHDLRHTMASLWMQGGGDLFKLQQILGHSDIKMTLRYAHLAPTAFSDDYQRLGSEDPLRGGSVIGMVR